MDTVQAELMKADIDDIIRQAKRVLSLRDETGGIPATIDNTSALQALSMYIQWYEAGRADLAKQLQGSRSRQMMSDRKISIVEEIADGAIAMMPKRGHKILKADIVRDVELALSTLEEIHAKFMSQDQRP